MYHVYSMMNPKSNTMRSACNNVKTFVHYRIKLSWIVLGSAALVHTIMIIQRTDLRDNTIAVSNPAIDITAAEAIRVRSSV